MSYPPNLDLLHPPWSKNGKLLESLVRKAIYNYKLLPGEDSCKVAVALSGGKDSLALLVLLHAISARGVAHLDLVAIHIHGAYSCGANISLEYLQFLCDHLQIPLIVEHTEQELDDLECYSCSRQRRSLLFKCARKFGAQKIAFGHHRDDNIQTMLMNMLHKASLAGMLASVPMHRYGVEIIRPMILCAEEDIVEFARYCGFLRISCQCPVGQKSKRKEVEQVLCQMQKAFPNARENLSRVCLERGDQGALNL